MPNEACKLHACGMKAMPYKDGRTTDSVGKWDSFSGQLFDQMADIGPDMSCMTSHRLYYVRD